MQTAVHLHLMLPKQKRPLRLCSCHWMHQSTVSLHSAKAPWGCSDLGTLLTPAFTGTDILWDRL
jgi:hypothetical protein